MNKIITCFLFCLFILNACNMPADSPYTQITFIKKSGLPDGGRCSGVAFVANNKAYYTLGRNNEKQAKKNTFEYDPKQDKWIEKAEFPGIARVNAFAAVVNNIAYVGLGFNPLKGVYVADTNLKDFWSYNPVDNQWTRKADFPHVTTNKCISFVLGDEIFVGFGFNGFGFDNDMWKYNIQTDKWLKLKKSTALNRAGAVACKNDKNIYFGTGYRTYNMNDWWEYFPETDSWEKRKSMPDNGRINAVSFSLNNRIFVATGHHFGGDMTTGRYNSDVLEYDTDKDVWYFRGNIPDGERENAVSFVIDGKAYIGFGENEKEVLNDLWSFEI